MDLNFLSNAGCLTAMELAFFLVITYVFCSGIRGL